MTADTTVKTPTKKKSGSALRRKVRALGVASGECRQRRNRQHNDTYPITGHAHPIELILSADGTIYTPDYWAFLKGHSEVAAGTKHALHHHPLHGDDIRLRRRAALLLRRVPERLTAYQKGYLYAVATCGRLDAIPVRVRRNVHRLFPLARGDFEETS